jgi:hypothetical protein
MDVTLRPAPFGCLMAVLGIMTLGLIPLARRFAERHFIRRMDDAGFETRGGRRIAWNEVTSLRRITTTMGSGTLSDELVMSTRRGRASLPVWRAEKAAEVVEFAMRRLPPDVRKG